MLRSTIFTFIASLIICPTTLLAADPIPREVRSDLGKFLEERGLLVSWDTAGGYANNVYLTSEDEESDLFFNAMLRAEWRKSRNEAESLYVDATVERRQYLSESDASELFWDLLAEYVHDLTPCSLGFSGTVSYENYRTFDEEGGVLPAGEYESLGSTVRGFGAASWADSHEVEAGAAYRVKRYAEDEHDYNEIAVDLSYRWYVSDVFDTRAVLKMRTQDYADYEAFPVSSGGTDPLPTLDRDIRIMRVEVNRDIGRHGYGQLFVRRTTSEENFEEEGNYDETAFGLNTSFQLWGDFAVHGNVTASSRDYDNRLTTDDEVQKDNFLSMEVGLERGLAGTVSALLNLELSTRDSNDSTDEYSEGALSLGFRGML